MIRTGTSAVWASAASRSRAAYGFYPWLIGTVTYYGSNNIGDEKNLSIVVGNYNVSHIVQFDLTAKF